eukprot:6477282-Amphidinium_carterae.2
MREGVVLSLGVHLEACVCQPKVGPPHGRRFCSRRQQQCWALLASDPCKAVTRARSSARYTD